MRYAYQMLCRNGMLIGGLGGASSDEADTLGQGDALVVVTQAPYAAATLELARSAAERGAAVIALTDAPTSPILPFARHVLRFARPRMRPATRADPLRSSTARRACSAWPST